MNLEPVRSLFSRRPRPARGDSPVARPNEPRPTEPGVRRITLIGKPGCHLCDEARAVVEKVAAETGAEVEEINMLEDPELVARYAEQIPVTLVDGAQHDYWRVDERRLRAALGAA